MKKFVFLQIATLFVFCTSAFCFQRIISLSPQLTKEIYLLGAEDKLIGYTIYAPSYAKNKEKVGTVTEANLEKIIELKPDLVLATPLTDPEEIEKLKKMDIKVVLFPRAKSFDELCRQFLELAKFAGKEEKARRIVQKARKEIGLIKNKTRNLDKTKVFVQVGARPLFSVNRDSFINDLIEFAGGENIAKNAKSGLYSREKVLKEDPDVIIIVTMGIVGEREKEKWKRYKCLKAVKNKRIYMIDSDKICSPTPISFVNTLKEIVEILHPGIKWIKD